MNNHLAKKLTICLNELSLAHHNAYFRKRALEAARGVAFAEIPRF